MIIKYILQKLKIYFQILIQRYIILKTVVDISIRIMIRYQKSQKRLDLRLEIRINALIAIFAKALMTIGNTVPTRLYAVYFCKRI